jgi:hypothetical protein
MAIKDRLRKLEQNAPTRCPECMEKPEVMGVMHKPDACNEVEIEAGYPGLRSLIKAGWFAPNAPTHEHVPISDETRAAINSGQIVVDEHDPDQAAVQEIARREPHLWRCKEGTMGEATEPCPVCGFQAEVFQIVHTHAAAWR